MSDYYTGKGKPHVVGMYTEMTSLQKSSSETVTEYIICVEKIITALRNADEKLSDGLLIAIILKGRPESFKLFATYIAQIGVEISFSDFKT